MLRVKTFAEGVVRVRRTCKRSGKVRIGSIVYIVYIFLPERIVAPDPVYSIKDFLSAQLVGTSSSHTTLLSIPSTCPVGVLWVWI
jgi:hypothetical protein